MSEDQAEKIISLLEKIAHEVHMIRISSKPVIRTSIPVYATPTRPEDPTIIFSSQ